MTEQSATLEPIYSALGGDEDLAEIVEMFVDEMPTRISALLGYLDNSDWEALRVTAHQLKGAAGSYGFTPISPCAATLEDSIREEASEERIQEAVEDLVAMCRRARAGTPS